MVKFQMGMHYVFANASACRARDASGVVHVLDWGQGQGFRKVTLCQQRNWSEVEPLIVVDVIAMPTCITCLGLPS